MADAFGKIMAIIFCVFALFFLPLTIVALKMDNTSQAYIDDAVVEFVDNARATAIITDSSYEELCSRIDAVQGNCTIKITHSSKYITLDSASGELITQYYDYTKDDILKTIYTVSGDNEKYKMKNGDFISVTVYNNSPTLATQLYRMIMPSYNQSGVSIYTTYSGYVGNNAE